jgi:spermidine synthase
VLLLAVTNQMCQEVAVIPLLWVLPLGLYLLSFILCFESDRAYRRGFWFLALLSSAAGSSAILAAGPSIGVPLQIAGLSAVLLSAAMACHGELSRIKPGPSHLTSFYMAVAAGGAAGGIFVGIVAPRVFRAFWEFPLGLWACGLLFSAALHRDRSSPFYTGPVLPSAVGLVAVLLCSPLALAQGRGRVFGVTAAVVAVAMVALARKAVPPGTLVRSCTAAAWLLLGCGLLGQALASVLHAKLVTRNFYGVLRVDERRAEPSGESYFALKHGQITHGVQYRAAARQREATAYFGPTSGIGRLMRALRDRAAGRPLRVGVVGLGVGTLAAYGEAGDELRFYEINPRVIEVAGASGSFFRYLADSAASVATVPGDARLSLEREASQGLPGFDLLILDAFNSDAVPVHLLTREALDVYLRRVRSPDGVVAFNLTNRFLELRPVALALARERGLGWASFFATPPGELEFASMWAVLTRDESLLSTPSLREGADRGMALASRPPWTDDHSDLLRALR